MHRGYGFSFSHDSHGDLVHSAPPLHRVLQESESIFVYLFFASKREAANTQVESIVQVATSLTIQ